MQVENSDYDSDGSDYYPEKDVIALEDDDDELVDLQRDDIVLTRMGDGLVIQDVPIPNDFCADPRQISVAELEEQICFHIQKGTLAVALTKVDITSKVFSNPQYPPREIQLGKDRYPPRESRHQVIQKTYGTPLHYACRDPNGSRGEHKIRFLLWVAGHYKIPVHKFLDLSEVTVRKYGNKWDQVDTEEMPKSRYTPLYILLDNRNSSVNAVRLLAEAWPSLVHLQYFSYERTMGLFNTLSHVLLKNPVSPDHPKADVSRVVSLVKVLLEVAAKSDLGAKSLIVPGTQLESLENTDTTILQRISPRNAIEIVLSHGTLMPPEMLATMLPIWPEALQKLGRKYAGDRSCLLHAALHQSLRTLRACQWQAKCIEAIVRYSSLESVVLGLMRTADDGKPQFHHLMERISEWEALDQTEIAGGVLDALKDVLSKRDTDGKTVLHHVVVAPPFGYSLPRHRNGSNHRKRRRIALESRRNYHLDLVQWILQQDPSLAWVCDNQGHNALHAALKSGNTWKSGVQEMIQMVPDWQYEPTKLVNGEDWGLLPFQIAATATIEDDVDTVYELLKITGPLAFAHVIH